MEYKSFAHLIKSAEDDRTITAIGAVTGNIDDGYDKIWAGAFAKTLAERLPRVKYLWQHDFSQPPIATILEAKEIGKRSLPAELRTKYPEATGALEVKVRYFDTPRSQEVLTGIKEDAISEHSIGYDPVKYDFEEQEQDEKEGWKPIIRNLREVRLWDVSPVNWGMNPATMVTGKELAQAGLLDLYRGTRLLLQERGVADGFGDTRKVSPTIMQAALSIKERPSHHLLVLASALEVLLPGDAGLTEKVLERTGLQGAKAGRVLSAANLERLKNALSVLSEILSVAEPEEEPKTSPLTSGLVLKRLEIALRELEIGG